LKPYFIILLKLIILVALRPDLANLKKVVYFHENQSNIFKIRFLLSIFFYVKLNNKNLSIVEYPIRKETTRNKNQIENKDQRDFQYGYNQILTRFQSIFKFILKVLFN
jgi:hypothetical protein